MSETSSTNLATPWRFRDGTEYLVTILVNEHPKWVSLSLSDKITAEEWSGQFDSNYIENLTQRTGNYKPFDTFVAMIKCAVLKKSDSVTLDLMSYEDLVALRDQKKRSGSVTCTMRELNLGPNLTKFESRSEADCSRETRGEWLKHPNKYLIITYVAEFDKVHYPLPLKYTGYPDAMVMQQTIQKLKAEVTSLKQANVSLMAQLKAVLKPEYGKFARNNFNRNFTKEKGSENDSISEVDSGSGSEFEIEPSLLKGKYKERGSQAERLQSLAHMVKNLETRIEGERNGHQGKLSKLEAENESLRNKLKSIEASECLLKEKVSRLESVLAINVGIKKTPHSLVLERPVIERDLAHKESYLLRSSTSNRNNDRPPGRRGNLNLNMPDNDNLSSSSRCSSLASKSSKQDCTANSIHNTHQHHHRRSSLASAGSRRSSGERRTFNPTEYVKKKKQKQEQLAKIRLARVETRIHGNNKNRHGILRNEKSPTTNSQSYLESRENKPTNSNRGSLCNLPRQPSVDRISTKTDLEVRQASPSPVRQPQERSNATERPSRKKTRGTTRTITRSSYEDIIESKIKDSLRSSVLHTRHLWKSKGGKSDFREPRKAESSLSFDKLQKRLHTIHAFLELNKKS